MNKVKWFSIWFLVCVLGAGVCTALYTGSVAAGFGVTFALLVLAPQRQF